MERNKAAILRSGIDPEMKRLRRHRAIKDRQAKKFVQACEDIERYWDDVSAAIKAKESE